MYLSHWGGVTHICVCNPTIIVSYNGLSPDPNQAIIINIIVMGPALPLQLASRVVIMTPATPPVAAQLACTCSCTCLNAFMFQNKWFVRYRYTVYHSSLHISRPVFSKQPRKDTPWLTCKGEVWEVFKWLIVWSELWLCSACFCSILRWPTVI